ncbi:MAG: glycosyltransferase family 39 protein [Nitrospirae bacterium]|nr:glycosyltransferase family 39 protein [Nitrospirota bacterium]
MLNAGRPRLRDVGLVAAAALLHLALLIPPTLQHSFYHDEVMELPVYRRGVVEIVSHLASGNFVRPPLFGLLQHVWMGLWGESEVALRSLSIVFSVLCVPAMGALGRVAFGEGAARAAIWLCAVSPLALLWGRVAGWYPVMMLWVLLANRCLLGRGGGWASAGYFVTLVLALYTNYYAVALVTAHALFLLWARPEGRRGKLVALALAIAAFAPWVPVVFSQFAWLRTITNLPEGLGWGKTTAYVLYAFTLGETFLPSHAVWVTIAAAGAGFLLWAAWREGPRRATVLFLGQIALMLAAGLLSGSLAPYRAYPFASLYWILLARGMGKGAGRIGAILLAVPWIWSVVNFETGSEYLKMGFLEPWREVHAELAETLGADDLVVHDSSVLAHYLRLRPIAAAVEPLPVDAEAWVAANTIRLAEAARVVMLHARSSYRPTLNTRFEALADMLRRRCAEEVAAPLLRDPAWREKARWAPGWAFADVKMLRHDFRGCQ